MTYHIVDTTSKIQFTNITNHACYINISYISVVNSFKIHDVKKVIEELMKAELVDVKYDRKKANVGNNISSKQMLYKTLLHLYIYLNVNKYN